MRLSKYILIASVVFTLAGCSSTSTLFSNNESITYESTLSSPNIGYIDYQSSDLLNGITRSLFVNVTYIGKNGPFDIKNIEITNVKPKNGSVRLYIPAFEDERFDQIDLIVDFGTVRVIGAPINGPAPEWKRLDRGQPIELTSLDKKIKITSGITVPGTYSANLLKYIKK